MAPARNPLSLWHRDGDYMTHISFSHQEKDYISNNVSQSSFQVFNTSSSILFKYSLKPAKNGLHFVDDISKGVFHINMHFDSHCFDICW